MEKWNTLNKLTFKKFYLIIHNFELHLKLKFLLDQNATTYLPGTPMYDIIVFQ